MLFTIIYALIALGVDALIFILTGLYNYPWFYWVPVIAFPVLYLLAFGVSLIFLFIASLFIDRKKEVTKPDVVARFFVTQIVHQLNYLSGSIVKKSNFNLIPHNEPYLIIYNHLSNFDPMFIMDFLHKDRIICVTKPQNIEIPIAGPFIHKAGYIAIDRENAKEGTKAILKAVDFVNKGYGSIAIAPEGSRSKTGLLQEFHPGSFQIGYHAHIPIVLMGFKNTNLIHKNFMKRFTKIDMNVLAVYSYGEYKDIPSREFALQAHKIYEDYLGENAEETK